jgi:predicted protein tyrosine phosphatase
MGVDFLQERGADLLIERLLELVFEDLLEAIHSPAHASISHAFGRDEPQTQHIRIYFWIGSAASASSKRKKQPSGKPLAG